MKSFKQPSVGAGVTLASIIAITVALSFFDGAAEARQDAERHAQVAEQRAMTELHSHSIADLFPANR